MTGGHRGSDLIEDAIAEHEMRERLAHALTVDRLRQRGGVRVHVRLILCERHRRDADVVALLEKENRPPPAGVGDAVLEGRPANHGAAEHLALMRLLQE